MYSFKLDKIPRNMLEKSREIDYLNHTGVYFLFGTNENDEDVVYIGQAGNRKNGKGILERLFEHRNDNNKDYFVETVIFTTQNNIFGSTEISYLENRLCAIAKSSNRYIIKNEIEPTMGNVTEEKISELEEFIEYSKLVIGALGYKILESIEINQVKKLEEEKIFYLKNDKNEIDAKGKITSDGFVVLNGSRISLKETPKCPDYIKNRRKKILEKYKDGILKEDLIYKSPSTSAAVVIGSSANGRVEWKDKNGKTLKELEKNREI